MDPFELYDSNLEQVRQKSHQELESIVDILIAQDKDYQRIKKKRKREQRMIDEVPGIMHEFKGFLKEKLGLLDKVRTLNHTMKIGERYQRDAYSQVMKVHLKDISERLLDCSREYLESSENTVTCSIELYNRIKKEVSYLNETYARFLSRDVPEINDLLAINVFTQSDEQMEKIKLALSKLQKAGYITKRNSGYLINYLSPKTIEEPKKVVKKPVIMPKIRVKKEVKTEPKKDLEEITAEEIKNSTFFLTDLLKLEEETAQDYAQRMSTEDLILVYSQLAKIVGDDCSQRIIHDNPEVFDYLSNKELNKYFKVLKTICNGDDPEEVLCKHPTERYSSLDNALELKEELKPGKEINGDDNVIIEEPKTLEDINIHPYTFIHRNVPEVVRRVENLITEGVAYVNEHEHWGGASKGSRGANILINIKYQMKCLFSELGLDEPNCKINFGERKMYISEQDQQKLSKIVKDYKIVLEE